MPMEDLFRLARTTTVAQLLERDDFAKRHRGRRADLDPRAALPAAPGLRLGGGRGRRRAWRHRPDLQPPARRATSSRHTACQPQSILTVPILPGIDGGERMRKSLGNYVGVTEPPEEIFGKLMRVPDAAMPDLLRAAARRAVRPRTPGGGVEAGDGARAHGPLPRRQRRPRPPRRTSTGCTCSARRRTRWRSSPSRRTARPCTCRIFSATPSASRARRGGGCSAQGGVKLDGEPLQNGDLDLPGGPPRRSAAPGRQAPLQETSPRRWLSGSAALYSSVP